MVIISICSATLLLLSSALLLNEVTHLANYHTPLGEIDLCKAMKHAGKQTCGHLQVASVSFYFFCCIMKSLLRYDTKIIQIIFNQVLSL